MAPSQIDIGNVHFDSNLFLCPIAGYCDLPYRKIVRQIGGLGLAYTDLVNPRGLANKTARSMQIVSTCEEDRPLSIQLYGTDGDELADAAVWAAEHGSVVVDLNMGCPAKKVARKGGGSGLLRDCPNAVRLAEKVVKKCPVPVTVKTRLGWEYGKMVSPDLVRQMEDVGVAALTIHGRYGEQRFKGSVDYDGIRQTVQAAKRIPVIGNGDVRSFEDVKKMFDQTECHGVMIGRWALADPWIFRDTKHYLSTGEFPQSISKWERLDRMVDHFENMIEFYGPQQAPILFRKRMSWYCKTIGPCPQLRREMPRISTVDEFYSLVSEFREELKHRSVHYLQTV